MKILLIVKAKAVKVLKSHFRKKSLIFQGSGFILPIVKPCGQVLPTLTRRNFLETVLFQSQLVDSPRFSQAEPLSLPRE